MRKVCILSYMFLLTYMISCQKQDETNISSYNNRSHNMGKNCMVCHVKKGPGKGWFNVAGTIYDYNSTSNATSPDGNVYLYSDSQRTKLVASLRLIPKATSILLITLILAQGYMLEL